MEIIMWIVFVALFFIIPQVMIFAVVMYFIISYWYISIPFIIGILLILGIGSLMENITSNKKKKITKNKDIKPKTNRYYPPIMKANDKKR